MLRFRVNALDSDGNLFKIVKLTFEIRVRKFMFTIRRSTVFEKLKYVTEVSDVEGLKLRNSESAKK